MATPYSRSDLCIAQEPDVTQFASMQEDGKNEVRARFQRSMASFSGQVEIEWAGGEHPIVHSLELGIVAGMQQALKKGYFRSA